MVRPQPFCLGALLFLLLQFSTPLSVAAASKRAPDPGYVPALAAADHFLQAWQSGDVESGTALLSSHAKEAVTTEGVEAFFSEPVPGGYEIERGKLLKHGRYEFPVVLVTETAKGTRVRRRFSSIIVVNTGNDDWAVDKLP